MWYDDFNAKNKLCFGQENASCKGSILNDLMAQYGLSQIIHDPTHILESSISLIYVVFTPQKNLVTSSGVNSSLYSKYHSNSNLKNNFHLHSAKRVGNRGFSGLYFPAYGLNTKIYFVNLFIQPECGKRRSAPYERLIQKYKKANEYFRKRAIRNFDKKNKLYLTGITYY